MFRTSLNYVVLRRQNERVLREHKLGSAVCERVPCLAKLI